MKNFFSASLRWPILADTCSFATLVAIRIATPALFCYVIVMFVCV